MRAFLALCAIAVVGADVSELFDNGYNYPQPSGFFGDRDHSGIFPDSSLGHTSFSRPGSSNFGFESTTGSGVLDYDRRPGSVFESSHSAPTVSKRFFTVTGHDDGSSDGDDESDLSDSSSTAHKNIDVVFANNPASSSLRSTLKAFARHSADHQTDVYVLNQQLGARQLADAFRTSGIKPSRPHVHFVKYRTPEEAAFAQQRIRDQYNRLGGTTHDGGVEHARVQSVVGSLGYHRHGPLYGSHGSHGSHGHGGRFGGPHYGHGSYGHSGRGPFHGGASTLTRGYLPPTY